MGEYLANLRRSSGNDKCADCGKPGCSNSLFVALEWKVGQLCQYAKTIWQPGSKLNMISRIISRK